jgi:adenosyl cobinamide kinase/adenosyl cobinamide phosphate guanylyltransferase
MNDAGGRRSALASIHFVLGGARSGKSRHAEALVEAEPGPWAYIATAQAWDDEMRERIAEHRARRSPQWTTIEAPLDLASALQEAGHRPVLVDCLTLWVTNLLLGDHDIDAASGALLAALVQRPATTVLVSNETGLGIVPDNALARRFRDAAGILNQRVAGASGSVVFLVAGLPMKVK